MGTLMAPWLRQETQSHKDSPSVLLATKEEVAAPTCILNCVQIFIKGVQQNLIQYTHLGGVYNVL